MAAMYERFTDRARKVMQLANQEAQRFNHEYIGTEHILLGLVKEGSGVAAVVLANLDVDLDRVRREVEKIVQSGAGPQPGSGNRENLLPTPRAQKVIEFAIDEARNLNHNYVGTEHLLLGLLREEEGVAAQVLLNLGLRLDGVYEELQHVLGGNFPKEADNHQGEPNPYAELQGLPEFVFPILRAIDYQIADLEGEKENLVSELEFEKAAGLLNQVNKMKKVRNFLLTEFGGNPSSS